MFENAARYPNSETNFLCSHDCSMSSLSLVKLGPCTPENCSVKVPHPLKLHHENVLNHQRRGLYDWNLKVQGQEVKGQGHSMT